MFNLDMNISKPVILIIASSEKAYGLSHLSKEVTVYVNSKTQLFGNNHNIYTEDIPYQNMELIKWAEQKFGGVTSFTTVQNLNKITRTEAQEHYQTTQQSFEDKSCPRVTRSRTGPTTPVCHSTGVVPVLSAC
ncbi:hypothetical protein ATANTOWER_031898 [Ataeniobius toweri]|uniref:TGFBR3/Endoglin-like N-terminal domain-containing protein n=1 Tax=Ataeniobius toweri TaxID=208326 RepID=A0ABU7BXA7_9TELE|nr:hypothetical protein [Ataeniobius toweri]